MHETLLLSSDDIKLCNRKNSIQNKVLFGVILGYFKTYMKFPDNKLPTKLILQIVAELNVTVADISGFERDMRSAKRFRQQIRKHLGYREAIDSDSGEFIDYLIKDILPKQPSESLLAEQIRSYFQEHKIEFFKDTRLARHISSAKHQFEQKFFSSIYEKLSANNRYLIDQTLIATENDLENGVIELSELKRDIPGARLKNVGYTIDRINLLRKIKIPESVFVDIDRKVLLKYYDRIMALSPSNILEFSPVAKYSIMAIFFHIKLQVMLDALADTTIKLIHRMRTSASKYVDNYILREVKRVDGKFDILEKLAVANANHPKVIIEDKVYTEVSRAILLELINDLKHNGKWYQSQVQEKIHSNYVHGNRRVLLSILRVFSLKEDHIIYKPILDAIDFINKHWDESDSENYLTMPPIGNIIPSGWRSMVITGSGKKKVVNKYNYEIAVLEQLKSFLGYKAIWVENSYRYRNPQEDTPRDFEENRESYYKMLGLPICGKEFVAILKKLLGDNLDSLNTNIPNNNLVKIKASTVGKNIVVTPYEAQKAPANIDRLQDEIIKRWSSINLIDILKECDLLINFTEQMETVACNSKIDPTELRKRLLLCLYGIGSNTGLKRISIANGDVSCGDLRYTKKRFLNKTNVRNAIRSVVNKVLDVRDEEIWGEATTSVACDSTQVSAWDQNLINEWHHRYNSKGVMIYWHVDKKALCIFSQLKTCSSSEAAPMIKGIIDHDTAMNMNRVFVDTHGQSFVGFAVSYLLGFNLLPRFKAINKQKLYAVTARDKKKYIHIEKVIKGVINWKIIEDNYDEVVKYMVALKLGIVEPSVLVKRFSKNNYNHPVYQALLWIGRANKSIFLCEYLSKEELRIEIGDGLNIVERLNFVMSFIFYGKLGELRTNNTEDQELSVLCLHLLQACIVYINTLIIQQVLSEAHWKNRFTPEDYRALTPLLSMHINPYGLFPIDFTQRILINAGNQ